MSENWQEAATAIVQTGLKIFRSQEWVKFISTYSQTGIMCCDIEAPSLG